MLVAFSVVLSLAFPMVAAVQATAASAAGGTGAVTLLSTAASGAKADAGIGALFSMSGDGSKVAFTSASTNLVDPAPPSGPTQIYVKDTASGLVQLASSAADGTPANGGSSQPNISRNGRYVVFTSDAANLSPADTDSVTDLYVKDLATGTVTLASTNSAGVKGTQTFVGQPAVSDDGTRIVFSTNAGNYDARQAPKTCTHSNGHGGTVTVNCTETELYLKDLGSGATTLLSLGDNGMGAVAGTISDAISSNGQRVVIDTPDALVPEDTDGGQPDVYVIDVAAGTTTLVSTPYAPGTPDSDQAAVFFPYTDAAADRVVFQGGGSGPWSLGGTASGNDAWVKDLGTGQLTLVSARADGTSGNALSQDPEISADGAYVSFSSNATNLDPADTDGGGDIYLRNLDTGELRLVSVRDDGQKADGYAFISAPLPSTGDVMFVSSATNLDPADTDGIDDLYLKRWPTLSADANGDGIADSLQPSGTPAGSFLDTTTSPATFGSIVNANGLAVTISDAPDLIDGVQIAVGPGSGRATISACGFTHRFSANSVAVISCGSTVVRTTAGDVEVVLDGGGTVVSIPQGATAEVATGPGGTGAAVSKVAGAPVTVTVEGVLQQVPPGSPAVTVAAPTPPVIAPTVTGTMGSNGWYVSDASVSWAVSDPESSVTATSAGGTTTVSADAGPTVLTCQATSAGGSASASVTIKRDATGPNVAPAVTPAAAATGWYNRATGAPTVSYSCADAVSGVAVCPAAHLFGEGAAITYPATASDNAGNTSTVSAGPLNVDLMAPMVAFATHPASYTVDQTIAIPCSATDSLSGIATTCTGVSRPASSLPVGTTTLSTSATDRAGNSATASTPVTVQVTPSSLCNLTKQLVQGSARYQALPAAQKAAVNQLATAACTSLDGITAKLTAKQKAALVAAYLNGVAALVRPGWLTADQAALLTTLANRL